MTKAMGNYFFLILKIAPSAFCLLVKVEFSDLSHFKINKMKNFIFCLIPFVCFACYIPKNLSKDKPVSEDVIAKIRPGKKYEIYQKSGSRILLYVKRCDTLMVYGKAGHINSKGQVTKLTPYANTFQELVEGADKIYLRKFNPWLSFGPPIILTACLLFYTAENFEYKMDFSSNGL